ncbi:hypothetical protein DF3PB_3350005 [uncultured Defluviicoccus sp.]|uniref:Uncharacterized protein n=1 Tax=metagenome TaxID=256318 RepID=A0A380TEF8_9ZZZZ|nr:hypothetical protein DF3PB_3350005 [uncultured Defluviicoccus sp.]
MSVLDERHGLRERQTKEQSLIPASATIAGATLAAG